MRLFLVLLLAFFAAGLWRDGATNLQSQRFLPAFTELMEPETMKSMRIGEAKPLSCCDLPGITLQMVSYGALANWNLKMKFQNDSSIFTFKGIGEIDNRGRPNERKISNVLCAQSQSRTNHKGLSVGVSCYVLSDSKNHDFKGRSNYVGTTHGPHFGFDINQPHGASGYWHSFWWLAFCLLGSSKDDWWITDIVFSASLLIRYVGPKFNRDQEDCHRA